MPTICIDCRYIDNGPSGIAEVVAALARHVPALAPDLRFLLLRRRNGSLPLSPADNVSEIGVPCETNGPVNMWALPLVADLADVDLFHAPSNILPAGLPMPCVTTIHDLMWLTSPDLCHRGAWGWLERAFHAHGIRRAIRKSAAIATVSEATRDAIASVSPAAAAKTYPVLSGVCESFRPVAPDPDKLAALGLDPARRYVLTVGQYAPYKNHEGALAAFALASRDRPGIDLVFLQRRGAATARLERMAESRGLAGRVHFLRNVSRDDLLLLYSSAVCLLHPSFCEGFGNPLAEAMACGCPVVTGNVSAMREVTEGAALLAPPDDIPALAQCLARIAEDCRLAETLRRNGLARAAELGWEKAAASYISIYRAALSASPPKKASSRRAASR